MSRYDNEVHLIFYYYGWNRFLGCQQVGVKTWNLELLMEDHDGEWHRGEHESRWWLWWLGWEDLPLIFASPIGQRGIINTPGEAGAIIIPLSFTRLPMTPLQYQLMNVQPLLMMSISPSLPLGSICCFTPAQLRSTADARPDLFSKLMRCHLNPCFINLTRNYFEQ